MSIITKEDIKAMKEKISTDYYSIKASIHFKRENKAMQFI
jgi:hypothetical protein